MKSRFHFLILAAALALAACNPVEPTADAPIAVAPTAEPILPTSVAEHATLEPVLTTIPSPTLQPTPTFVPIAPTPTLVPLALDQRQTLFEQVWELVRDHYVYTDYHGLDWDAIHAEFVPRIAAAPSEDAFYDLMRELIERLADDHSVFLSPQDVAREEAEFDSSYRFGGIGVRIREQDDGALITDVAEAGPAEQAGIQRRELITKIEGRPVAAAWDAGENPMLQVRGEPGTTVVLTVRSANGLERDITLTRQVIGADAFPAIKSQRLPNTNVGFLQLDTFNQEAIDQDVRKALEGLLADGPLDSLIIDVRDNGGGRLDYLTNIVALFLDGGNIGNDAGRGADDTIMIPGGETIAALASTPIAILTGPDSVSAAEIFAAGMQARGRAIVVGEPSAGNTEVLLSHDLSDGSALRLAERAYRRPDGSLLEGTGVQPDRLVSAEWWRYAPQDDPQVLAALDVLKEEGSRN